MSPKRITDPFGLDEVAQWARDALAYSHQPEFHRQTTEAILELGGKHGATLGPVGLVGVVITSGLWELLDRFAPRGERCGLRELNELEIAVITVLLNEHRTLAVAAELAPSVPTPGLENVARIWGWRTGWYRAVTEAQSAVERDDATASQRLILELVRLATESRVGADKGDAARLIAAMFGAVAQRKAEPELRKEQLAEVTTALYLSQMEKPARLANTLFRKKDGKFTFSELGFRDLAGDRDRKKRKTVNVEDLAEELADNQAGSPLDAAAQAEAARLVIEARTLIEELRDETLSRRDVSPAQELVANYAPALLAGEISARALAETNDVPRQSIDAELKKLREQVVKRMGPKEL